MLPHADFPFIPLKMPHKLCDDINAIQAHIPKPASSVHNVPLRETQRTTEFFTSSNRQAGWYLDVCRQNLRTIPNVNDDTMPSTWRELYTGEASGARGSVNNIGAA